MWPVTSLRLKFFGGVSFHFMFYTAYKLNFLYFIKAFECSTLRTGSYIIRCNFKILSNRYPRISKVDSFGDG